MLQPISGLLTSTYNNMYMYGVLRTVYIHTHAGRKKYRKQFFFLLRPPTKALASTTNEALHKPPEALEINGQ